MKATVYSLANEAVGEVELPAEIFGAKWNGTLVAQAVNAQRANLRRPWAHAKTRAEVRGGGRKPWQQKGTGNARHGSTRSPIWVGGGKAHGPNKERDYSQKLNKKMRRGAIFSVLSKKLADNELRIVQDFNVAEPKTNVLYRSLAPFLGITSKAKKVDALIIRDPENAVIARIARNLVKTKVLSPASLNVYDLVNHKHILVDAGAIPVIRDRYLEKPVPTN